MARKIRNEWPLRGSDEVSELVKDVVRRLAAAQPPRRWHISVIRNRNAEAYSIGDGRIYVSDGAVRRCETESELAAILAHEMAHQMLGHFCDAATETDGDRRSVGSVTLRRDPARELAADSYGLDLIARVGYDPQGARSIAGRVQGAVPRGHLEGVGRVARLDRLLKRYRPILGFESAGFGPVKRLLSAEKPLP